MPFDDGDKQRVLDATDIAGFVGEHLALKPKGREFVALCPFHDDRNPSMHVVPHKGIYHCFVCGAGGDAITFAMRYLSLTFPEALELLAERAGITLAKRRQRDARAPSNDIGKREILAANERAQRFFRAVLAHPDHGRAARELLDRRGLDDETAEAFGIGAAPDRWDGLLLVAKREGLPTEALAAAGLVKARENREGHYDALRNRLTFPIRDETGRVTAFGARRIDDNDEPKYLNSPEHTAFHKSRTLYGIDRAARAIRDSGRAVIVEGYTDVIACHRAGLTNVVGTLGTALTAEHAARLRGRAREIVLLFDADEAGRRAADRAFEVMFRSMIDVRVALLGADPNTGESAGPKDPDELLRTDGGPDTLRRTIDGAEHIIDFWAGRLGDELASAGPTEEMTKVQQALQRLNDLGLESVPPVMHQRIITGIAGRCPMVERVAGQHRGVSEVVRAERSPSRPVEGGTQRNNGTPDDAFHPGSLPPAVRRLLAACLTRPQAASANADRVRTALEHARPALATHPAAQRLGDIALQLAIGDRSAPAAWHELREGLPETVQRALTRLVLWFEHAESDNPREQEGVLLDTLRRLELDRQRDGATSQPPPGTADTIAELDPPGSKAGAEPLAARLDRVRRVHGELGGNPAANPYRRRTRPGTG